jgi:hypothetical protein
MENWFKTLLELDNYETLANHNKNDEPNMIRVFPKKELFRKYDDFCQNKGNIAFIKFDDFSNYLSNNNYEGLNIVSSKDFILELNNTQQLRSINSDTFEDYFYSNESHYSFNIFCKFGLREGKSDLLFLGRDIEPKHNFKNEEYSYVMFYVDRVMEMVVVFKSTYHEVGKKDLSYNTFKEENSESTAVKVDSELEALNVELDSGNIDVHTVITKLSNSHIINELILHPTFVHEVKYNERLNNNFQTLIMKVKPRFKYTKKISEKLFGV